LWGLEGGNGYDREKEKEREKTNGAQRDESVCFILLWNGKQAASKKQQQQKEGGVIFSKMFSLFISLHAFSYVVFYYFFSSRRIPDVYVWCRGVNV
jgi:hypothetical protein